MDASNLMVRAMQGAAARSKVSLPGAHIEVQNDIPLGIGLGSSAAAIVAGTVMGAELCGVELDAAETLRLALEMEGHPDNIAAAVHGGMVVAAITSQQAAKASEPVEVLVARVDVSPKLDFIVVIPETPLPTEKARAALPAEYVACRRSGKFAADGFADRVLFLRPQTIAGAFSRSSASALSQPACARNHASAGVSPSRAGGNFFERGRFGGYGHRRAQRRAHWGGVSRRISAPGCRSPGRAIEGRQSRRASNHGRSRALAGPSRSDPHASRVTPRT